MVVAVRCRSLVPLFLGVFCSSAGNDSAHSDGSDLVDLCDPGLDFIVQAVLALHWIEKGAIPKQKEMNTTRLRTFGMLLIVSLFLGILSVGCFHEKVLLESLSPQHYTFSGTLYLNNRRAGYCNFECLSDSGRIQFVQPDFFSGEYNFELSATQARKLQRFRITAQGLDTLIADFDQLLLKDSIIITNFAMKETPMPYLVKIMVALHTGKATNDTTWLDLKGNRVSKAVSDSLWRKER